MSLDWGALYSAWRVISHHSRTAALSGPLNARVSAYAAFAIRVTRQNPGEACWFRFRIK